jgi:hypothetical protein
MANTTISALPSATTPLSGTEVVPIVQSGVTKKVAASYIGNVAAGSNTQIQYNSSNVLAGSANLTFDGAQLGVYGITVGRGAGAVATNTAVGASALGANTSGSLNTAIGYQAGLANTTAAGLTLVGHQAGVAATAGNLTAVGYQALVSNTSGLYNTALGQSALQANTTASNNTAVGYQAGYGNTTASYNTAVGYQAGYSNTTGDSLSAFGPAASLSNTTGVSNSSFGRGALYANTTGSYNTGIGQQALQGNTTASYNTAVGYQAGYSNTTSSDNTFIGYVAGFTFNTTGQGFNAAIGRYAGYGLTTGTKNTFVGGTGSGYLITTGVSNTILGCYTGNQGGLDIRTASNYIVLSDGDGNPRGIFDSNGNFLLGTTTFTTTPTTGVQLGNYLGTTGAVYIGHASGVASGNLYANFAYNGAQIGSISQSGTTAVLFNVTSDQRLKENIVDAPEFGSVIDSFQVRSFDWKADNTHQRAGFVAQELVTVAPEAVYQPIDTEEMMAVDYSKLVPMLVKEIQSLRKRLAVAGIA